MPVLVRFNDPSNLSAKEVYYPNAGDNLLDFLADNFTANFGGLHTDIYINKELLLSTADISDSEKLNDIADRVILENDSIAVITRPADPVTALYVIVAALAIAAVVLLAPKVPGQAEGQGSSPNNQLNAATNEFRPNQGIPEVFGSPASYPDFVQPSFYLYENNLKIQRELLCVGMGRYDITKVLTSDTDINSIPNSSWTKYETGDWDGQLPIPPVIIPDWEQRITVRETNEITSQSLEAKNTKSFEFDGTNIDVANIGADCQLTYNDGIDFITDMELVVGDYLTVNLAKVVGPSTVIALVGTFQVGAINEIAKTILLLSAVSPNPDTGCQGTATATDSSGEVQNWIGWYGVSGNKNEQVWFHVIMPSGIRAEDSGNITVDFEMQIREVDVDGLPIIGTDQTLAASISGGTLDPQFRTYKFEGLPQGRYQGRLRRTSDEIGGATVEKIVVEQIVGVEYQDVPNYGDVTLLWVERKASDRVVGGNQSKINVELTRKLPHYNRSTGLIEYSNLVATRDFADAAMYTLVIAGKRDINSVDLEELYRINDALPEALRTFDFTFDDADVGLRERVSVICNAARVLAFKDYQSWTFNRIEAKASHSMLFNRRNTIGDSNQSFPQWLPSDKDSVSISYVTQPDNVEKTVYRRIVNGNILSDEAGNYPLEINLVGCQSDDQAENRADYEIRSLLYQRDSVEFQTYYFGLSARIGDKVRWCDMNDYDVFGGEILDIFGSDYLTSERINFEPGKTYYVQTTRDDGSIGALATCSALSYTDKGFRSSTLAGAYTANDGNYEFGSKYVIAPDDELKGTDYTLKSVTNSGDGIATITLSEYNDKIFEAD